MNSKETSLLGLHLKLQNNLYSLISEAQNYKIKIFQFFLTREQTGKYLKLDNKDVKSFLKLRTEFKELYIHSSYWVNLASSKRIGHQTSQRILKKEIELAKKLHANYLVLHPGSASKFKNIPQDPNWKLKGIENLTAALNKIMRKEWRIRILLENTAHANRTIGSNLDDFRLIRERLEFPEKIMFCLDLAHAFSYGYDIEKTDDFIDFVDKTMGIKNIKLIHLNDSIEKKGSKIDKHESPGNGLIGDKTLKALIQSPKFKNTPIILELPNLSSQNTLFSIKTTADWL
ncbi:MAG: deoxyribonuclease IV [bacterium]